ncbi:MAG: hypothetical protein SGARI_000267 [Bacillariaceae sp.]
MSLSSFFLPAEKESDEKSPMASSCDKKSNKKRSKATSAAANGSSVLENLPSPRKRALEEAMAKAESVEDEKVAANPRADGTKKEPESAPATGGNEPELEDSDLKAESENSTSVGAVKGTEKVNEEEKSSESEIVDLSMEMEEEPPKVDAADQASSAVTAAKPKAPRKRAPKKTPKAAAAAEKKTPTTSPPKLLSEQDLPADRQSAYQKYRTMKTRYLERSSQLVAQATRAGGIEEENFERAALEPLGENESIVDGDEDFPTRVVGNIALVIEGSLVEKVCCQLKEAHGKEWSAESVAAKIKILAQRKACFDASTKSSKTVDLFEDSDADRLWRWEISTLDLLPSETLAKARKARTARKKVASYYSAVVKLIKSLDDVCTKIFDSKLPKLDSVTAKISQNEERVLKFEREAEKQRLANEAKAIKLQAKLKAKEDAAEKKRREKEEAVEQKRREKEEAAEKKRREKGEAVHAKEEAKRKKEEEKEQQEQAKKLQEEKKKESLAKQKNCLMSFFSAPKKTEAEPTEAVPAPSTAANDFDSEAFRSKINSSSKKPSMTFQKQSSNAKLSRKRRTKGVAVLVSTIVAPPEDVWDAPAYAEQKTIMVPNRYRFLSFHEDCRPPYHGTWSKNSSIVTGKTPFGKELSVFDYDYDSEAEWEEGDDEVGDDVDDDEKNQEEDADEMMALYDYDDGFCVSDDKMLDNEENADEETRAMYKKKLEKGGTEQQMHSNRIRILAPGRGGIPLHLCKTNMTSDRFEGYEKQGVFRALDVLGGKTLCEVKLCLDAFPQLHLVEVKHSSSSAAGNSNVDKDEYTKEAMIVMARAVHHSSLNSKDKVVEELRSTHSALFSVRAKATRKLDAIATKKKHPTTTGGYYWDVKKEILAELGLVDLIGKPVPGIENPAQASAKKDSPVATASKTTVKSMGKKKAVAKATTKKNGKSTTKAVKADTSTKKRKAVDAAATRDDSATPPKKSKSDEKPPSSSKSKGSGTKAKKSSPNAEAASAGMKNLMASFLKKN